MGSPGVTRAGATRQRSSTRMIVRTRVVLTGIGRILRACGQVVIVVVDLPIAVSALEQEPTQVMLAVGVDRIVEGVEVANRAEQLRPLAESFERG